MKNHNNKRKGNGEGIMVDFEEVCIIKIENINRGLSPYQKCRLVEDVRRGEE